MTVPLDRFVTGTTSVGGSIAMLKAPNPDQALSKGSASSTVTSSRQTLFRCRILHRVTFRRVGHVTQVRPPPSRRTGSSGEVTVHCERASARSANGFTGLRQMSWLTVAELHKFSAGH
jgi:hypothetical protein